MDQRTTLTREFERESHRIDQMIWDTMALRAGESVLFCGFGNDAAWIARALEIGVAVSVIESNEDAIRANAQLDVKTIRGSTSVIPAREGAFDAAVAFHYLHEIDPLFHSNVVSELARVGKRVIIVEPAPPTDPIGLRIATLYSRAKRELGSFEYYQQIDYWKKLLSIVKADVTSASFAFTRVPPLDAIKDTVALIIDTMEVEAAPESYLEELRALAKRPDAQLVPQARYVLVGAASGDVPPPTAGTRFRETPPEAEPRPAAILPPAAPTTYATAEEPEMPPVVPAGIPAAEPEPEFGPAPSDAADAAFGVPFAVPTEGPETPFGLPRSGFGWEWEPPEGERAKRPDPETP